MPVYTYRRADGTTFDYRQKFSDEPLSTDPTTGQSVTRVVQAAGIIFKGSGFYVNDTKGANKSAALPADKGEKSEKSDSDSSSTSDTKPAESSTPAKSETSSSTTSTASSAAD
jgi:putative FmdB family regulatory protein